MRRAFVLQMVATESMDWLMRCPMCSSPTSEVEDMVRFRRCNRCKQMVRTQDCNQGADAAWADQVVKAVRES